MSVGDLSFAFDPTKGETPQTIAQKRAIANAILGNTSHAPRDIGEGLNSIGQALMYRQMMKGVNKAEAEGNSGAAKIFGSLFGDQFPAAPAAPQASGAPVIAPKQADNTNAPSADVASATPDAGGDVESYIRQAAASRGIDPDIAVKVASGEGGLHDPYRRGEGPAPHSQAPGLGATENSFGPLQLYVSGTGAGLGDRAVAAGIDPRKNWKGGVDFALDEAAKKGWGQWYGAKAQGITGMMGIGQAPAQSPAVGAVNAMAAGQMPLPPQAPIPLPNPMMADSGAPTQVASLDPSAGMLPNAAAHLGVPFTGHPMTDEQRAARQAEMAPALAQIGQPYSPPPMPAPYAAIQQQLASQPNDAKAAIARAMLGQGQSFPAEMGPQDINPPGASSQAGNPDVVNAGLWPRGGQRVLDAMMNKAPMGAGMPMVPPGGGQTPVSAPSPVPAPQAPIPPEAAQGGLDPQTTQAAPLPPPTTVQDRPVAGAPAPDLSQIPAMAGGNSDVIAPGEQQGPSIQQLMQAAADPFVMQKYGPMVEALLTQKMKQGDPSYALDIADKKLKLQLEQQQLGGNFRGDSMDAQAWNILQTSDPTSKQYATAYSIVSQPKTQLVQTANGLVPVQVPPNLPSWLTPPGGQAAPSAAPGASPTGAPNAAATGGPAAAGGAIPGTKQPATETQARNGAIGKILLNEVPTLGANFSALADPKGQLLNAIPGGVGNAWQSEEYQRAATAVGSSVSNVLYSLSGASSNPDEVRKQAQYLTPAFGDKPAQIADKLQRFKTYVRAIASEANDPELSKNIEDAIGKMDAPAAPAGGQSPAAGSDADPLGLRK